MTSDAKKTVGKKKSCFVVSRIGDEGSEARRQADCVLEYIIKPSLAEVGYDQPVRVDKLDKPTHITTEIVHHLIKADLVIADLSGSNANVFYELGIRHAFRKPCIMLSNWEPAPPFDVGGTNIINFVHDDPTSHKAAISRVVKQIKIFEEGDPISNPVTVANEFAKLSESEDEESQLIVRMYIELEDLRSHVYELQQNIEYGKPLTRDSKSAKLLKSLSNNQALDDYLNKLAEDSIDQVTRRYLAYKAQEEASPLAEALNKQLGNTGSDEEK